MGKTSSVSEKSVSPSQWPSRPPIEHEEALEAHLDLIRADGETRAICCDLARDGVAKIELEAPAQALCDKVAQERDGAFGARAVNRFQDSWLRSSAVRRLATQPKVERLLEAAYGRPAFAFQTLNFRIGSEQRTHSDAIHFHSRPERFMCGVWTALEDIQADAGPLVYLPGSQRMPVLTVRSAGVNHARPTPSDYETVYLPALENRLRSAGLARKTALLRKGEALVWAANLAHGGSPIARAGSTRRSLVTHFFFKDCLYYTPITSDVEGGRLSTRLPTNVGTGGVEWPRANGRPARVGWKQVAEAAIKLTLRKVHSA